MKKWHKRQYIHLTLTHASHLARCTYYAHSHMPYRPACVCVLILSKTHTVTGAWMVNVTTFRNNVLNAKWENGSSTRDWRRKRRIGWLCEDGTFSGRFTSTHVFLLSPQSMLFNKWTSSERMKRTCNLQHECHRCNSGPTRRLYSWQIVFGRTKWSPGRSFNSMNSNGI